MRSDTPQLELDTLRHQQARTREDEVFGGLTLDEKAAYDRRQLRIYELERNLTAPGNRRPFNQDLF